MSEDRPDLQVVILQGLLARRLPSWGERLGHTGCEVLRDLGGSASLERIAAVTMERIRAEDPALWKEYEQLVAESVVAGLAIQAGATIDADGIISFPEDGDEDRST